MTEKNPRAEGTNPDMTRNSARRPLLVAATVLLWSTVPTSAPAVDLTAGAHPSSVAVDDFNQDGVADLAVTDYGSDTVSVLLGNGDGTFQAAVSYSVGSHPWSVAVGDFDGDGRTDLAVANGGSNTVSVLLGNGDGTFQPALNFDTGGSGAVSVVVGDFNRDGAGG